MSVSDRKSKSKAEARPRSTPIRVRASATQAATYLKPHKPATWKLWVTPSAARGLLWSEKRRKSCQSVTERAKAKPKRAGPEAHQSGPRCRVTSYVTSYLLVTGYVTSYGLRNLVTSIFKYSLWTSGNLKKKITKLIQNLLILIL